MHHLRTTPVWQLPQAVYSYLHDTTPYIAAPRGAQIAQLYHDSTLTPDQRKALIAGLEKIYEAYIPNFVMRAEVCMTIPHQVRGVRWLCDAVEAIAHPDLEEKALALLTVLSQSYPQTELLMPDVFRAAKGYITEESVRCCIPLGKVPEVTAESTTLLLEFGPPKEGLETLLFLCGMQINKGWPVDVGPLLGVATTRHGVHNVMAEVVTKLPPDARHMLRAHLKHRWQDLPSLTPLLPHI